MTWTAGYLQGIFVHTPTRFVDDRGWFSETWNSAHATAAGFNLAFLQDNHSFSTAKGTLRGLHYQRPPRAQDKLVRCSRGAILDVAVDVRKGSPTYGQWVVEELTAANGRQLLVPKGFLHRFITLMADAEVQYKCTDLYAANCDGAVRWDSVGIDWGTDAPVLSGKDAAAIGLADFDSSITYGCAA